jgi:hypothetical protein
MAQKYDERITLALTSQMREYLKLLADRQRTSVGDVVRQAVREYIDHQDDVIGSRSRLGSRVTRQLEAMQRHLVKQQARAHTLLLAAVILQQMRQGAQGSEVLNQIAQLADHAEDEIHAVLEAKA